MMKTLSEYRNSTYMNDFPFHSPEYEKKGSTHSYKLKHIDIYSNLINSQKYSSTSSSNVNSNAKKQHTEDLTKKIKELKKRAVKTKDEDFKGVEAVFAQKGCEVVMEQKGDQHMMSDERAKLNTNRIIKEDFIQLEQNNRTRDHMEDYCSKTANFMGDSNKVFYVLCDGHCGEDVARIAVERLPIVFAECLLKNNQNVEDSLTECLRIVDEEFTEYDECGATCNLVYICYEGDERVLYSANIGDSRTILVKKDESIRLSFDHKANVKSEIERVKSEGGIVVRGRLYATLAVTRGLGDYSFKTDGVGLSNIPFISRTVINNEDRFAIIASDGVWDVIDEEMSTQIVAKATNDAANVIANIFITRSMDLGSKDNISCIAIKLN